MKGAGVGIFMVLVAIGGALLAASVTGCERRGCSEASPSPDVCLCPRGVGCTHSCPATAPRCSLDCAQGNGNCAVSCGDNCSAMCQDATSCEATCGDDCQVACQHVAQACDVSVGERGVVHCEGAPVCAVTCRGSCTVGCADGACQVKCADPARCNVTCDKVGTAATLCPDGQTKTCGIGCDE